MHLCHIKERNKINSLWSCLTKRVSPDLSSLLHTPCVFQPLSVYCMSLDLCLPGAYSQHPHSSSQPSPTPAGGGLTPSSGLHGQCKHIVHTHPFRQNIHIHGTKMNKYLKTLTKDGHIQGKKCISSSFFKGNFFLKKKQIKKNRDQNVIPS